MDTSDPPRAALAADDVRICIDVLRAIEADRSRLTPLPPDQRRELLTLAGLVAKPERHDLVRMAKAFRRADRAAARERDQQLIARTGLRVQRRATRYTPLWLPEPPVTAGTAPEPTLAQALNCYVCKQPLTRDPPLLRLDVPRDVATSTMPSADRLRIYRGHYALITGARVKMGFQAAPQAAAGRRACHRHHPLCS